MTDANLPSVQHEHKSRMFEALFNDKKEALSLYNAINGTDYSDTEELDIVTLEDAIYMSMKNDVVFYNGKRKVEDRVVLKLSDSFEDDGRESHLEVKAVMLNINYGRNRELMEKCKTLNDYAFFVEKIREKVKQGLSLKVAANETIKYCIEHGYLRDFLIQNEASAMSWILTEYDEELHWNSEREIAREEGRQEGRIEERDLSIQKIIELCQSLGLTPVQTKERILTMYEMDESIVLKYVENFWIADM